MKISALASLLGVAATTLLPGVAASEVSSLRGTAVIPDEVDFLGLGINCDNQRSNPDACDAGPNTCYRIVTQCNNICDCTISGQQCVDGTCSRANGGGGGSSRNCNNINNSQTCRNTNGCTWSGGECRWDTDFDDDDDFDDCFGRSRNNCINSNVCSWDALDGECFNCGNLNRNQCNNNGDLCTWNGNNCRSRSTNFDDDNVSRSCRNLNRNRCNQDPQVCFWTGSQCIFNDCANLSLNNCQRPNNGCERAVVNGIEVCRPDASQLLRLNSDPLKYKDGEVEVSSPEDEDYEYVEEDVVEE